MSICKPLASIVRLALTLILIASPLCAQRRRSPAPKPQPPAQAAQPAPTFDSILAAESYRIYAEVRGVGQLLRSPGVSDVLDPLVKLASPPTEFKTLVKWLNSQADDLMSSRLMLATAPTRPKLPQILFVIEFSSPEDAQKFEPKLKSVLPELVPPPPSEKRERTKTSNEPAKTSNEPAKTSNEAPKTTAEPAKISGEQNVVNAEAKPQEMPPAPPQLVVKQAGSLLLLSDTAVSLKSLRPIGSKSLTEDSNFRQAHTRFSSDSVFVYIDIASFDREDRERRKAWEEEQKKQAESESGNTQKAEEEVVLPDEQASPEEEASPPFDHVVVTDPVLGPPTVLAPTVSAPPDQTGTELSGGPGGPPVRALSPSQFFMFTSFLFTGPPKWPEAIGVAANFDGESYVLRALLINEPEAKGSIIPFIPQLIPGPPLSLEAASIFPSDTKLLISASLDYSQIYETAAKNMKRQHEEIRAMSKAPVKISEPESPFAPFEAKLGIKIKEDLLPLLGNEIAVSLPVSILGLGSQPPPSPAPADKPGEEAGPNAPKESESQPIIAIAVKDKESLRILIPKIIDKLGFKGASMLAQSEKRGDTELVSYVGVLSYAFIENFLVISPDTKAVRHVLDSYLNHQTLGSDSRFRDATRWQPRQMVAQVYMPTELMEAYYELIRNPAGNNKLREFLSQLNPTSIPVTYAVSNEGIGPLHELHLPKNLVMFIVAGMVTETSQPSIPTNEAVTQSGLRMIASAEAGYHAGPGKGSFGTLEQLVEQNLVHKDLLEKYGYKVELTITGTTFEATAVPVEYGKTGIMSFFVDESGVVRGADRGGAPASAADKPIQ
ncbi:MAG TPA: DUF2950 family protein [Pyrinomonadaceae bacterium]|nr:DUF2950 family protein [Pyrinomonadaceae bacterium]